MQNYIRQWYRPAEKRQRILHELVATDISEQKARGLSTYERLCYKYYSSEQLGEEYQCDTYMEEARSYALYYYIVRIIT